MFLTIRNLRRPLTMNDDPRGGQFDQRRPFATTHWSMVIAAAKGSDSGEAKRALAQLCETYWYPLYAFVRRKGYNPNEAQDLTQEFFANVLINATFQKADQTRGRFRSFLLTSMQNFLANQHRAKIALKRGGGVQHLPLDFHKGEDRYQQEPIESMTPEKMYERRWAMTLMKRVLDRLADEQTQAGKGEVFDTLKHYLGGTDDQRPYREIAQQLNMPEGTIKVNVHRLRKRCRELLRDEISQTVETEAAVDDELRDLFQIVAS